MTVSPPARRERSDPRRHGLLHGCLHGHRRAAGERRAGDDVRYDLFQLPEGRLRTEQRLRYDRLDEAVRDFRRAAVAVAAATSVTAAVPTATVPAAAAARAAISGPAARRPRPRGEHRGADADLRANGRPEADGRVRVTEQSSFQCPPQGVLKLRALKL